MEIIPSLNRGLIYDKGEVKAHALSRSIDLDDQHTGVIIGALEDAELLFELNQGSLGFICIKEVEKTA